MPIWKKCPILSQITQHGCPPVSCVTKVDYCGYCRWFHLLVALLRHGTSKREERATVATKQTTEQGTRNHQSTSIKKYRHAIANRSLATNRDTIANRSSAGRNHPNTIVPYRIGVCSCHTPEPRWVFVSAVSVWCQTHMAIESVSSIDGIAIKHQNILIFSC